MKPNRSIKLIGKESGHRSRFDLGIFLLTYYETLQSHERIHEFRRLSMVRSYSGRNLRGNVHRRYDRTRNSSQWLANKKLVFNVHQEEEKPRTPTSMQDAISLM